MSAAADIVQRQLEAYNAQDLDAFCACFAEDVVLGDLNGAVTQTGMTELRARYSAMFAQYPNNKADVVNRITHGDIVIDHEIIQRDETLRLEALAIYTIKNGLIARCDFVR